MKIIKLIINEKLKKPNPIINIINLSTLIIMMKLILIKKIKIKWFYQKKLKKIIQSVQKKIQLEDDETIYENIKSKIYYIQYINDESEQFKYSFSKAHWKTKTINYKCSDYICESRLTAKIEINKIDKIIKLIEWEIKKPHSIKPEEHNYNNDNNILEDMKY